MMKRLKVAKYAMFSVTFSALTLLGTNISNDTLFQNELRVSP